MGIGTWIELLFFIIGIIVITVSIMAFIAGQFSHPHKEGEDNDNDIPSDDMTDSQKISMLIARITLMQTELEKKNLIIDDQVNKIEFFTGRINILEGRVKDLESLLYRTGGKMPDFMYTSRPLLLVTTDPIIQRQDEISLNKSKIDFHRVINATQDKVELEFRRARQSRQMYRYIMFSGHADRNGLKMSDNTYLDSYWLNQNMSGVEVLYLNGCETTAIADDLVGVVRFVISMDEKIPTKVAQSFAEIFWTGIVAGKTATECFEEALTVEPTAKAYASLR